MTEYNDYGFYDLAGEHSHAYIVPQLLQLLDKQRNAAILDLGCGNGAMVRTLLANGFNAFGVDASESGIALAAREDPERFALMDFGADDRPELVMRHRFDTLLSTEVIEHLYDPRKFVALCKTLLPPNGELIISTPYHGYLKNLLIAAAGKWDRHMSPLWDGGHIKLWTRRTLTTLLEEQGFRVTAFAGCGRFPYLWKSMLVKAVRIDA